MGCTNSVVHPSIYNETVGKQTHSNGVVEKKVVTTNPNHLKGDYTQYQVAKCNREKQHKERQLKLFDEANALSGRVLEERERLSLGTRSRGTSRNTSRATSPSTTKRVLIQELDNPMTPVVEDKRSRDSMRGVEGATGNDPDMTETMADLQADESAHRKRKSKKKHKSNKESKKKMKKGGNDAKKDGLELNSETECVDDVDKTITGSGGERGDHVDVRIEKDIDPLIPLDNNTKKKRRKHSKSRIHSGDIENNSVVANKTILTPREVQPHYIENGNNVEKEETQNSTNDT